MYLTGADRVVNRRQFVETDRSRVLGAHASVGEQSSCPHHLVPGCVSGADDARLRLDELTEERGERAFVEGGEG